MQDFFLIWQDVGLLLYSVLKAFLPLPSLEVILTPLCLKNPQKWVIYAMEGAIGTCVGGAIGYMIAKLLGKKAFSSLVSEEDMQTIASLNKDTSSFFSHYDPATVEMICGLKR